MVAEPVSTALMFLNATYDSVSDTLLNQLTTVVRTVSGWTSSLGWGSKPPVKAGTGLISTSNGPWIERIRSRKYEIAVLGTALGLTAYALYRYNKSAESRANRPIKKRRVPKLPNGARKDVVLVVGSPTEPLTRLLALDFEKRGFIVYLTIMDDKDLRYTQSNHITDDLNYLNLAGGADLADLIGKFQQLLHVPVTPIKGGEGHLLELAAVVFAPNLYFPLGPLENFPLVAWERAMTRLQMYFQLLGSGFMLLVREHRSKVIVLVPNIVSSLGMAYHGPETLFQNSVKDLFGVLSKEVASQGISVSQIRIGNLNLTALSPKARVPAMVEAEIRSWGEDLQGLYGRQFLRQQAKSAPQGRNIALGLLAGLHHLLFDMIYSKKASPAVVYYGSGARAYERLAALLPTLVLQMFL